MQPIDTEVVRQIVDWLQAGEPCWHCTIVSTYGSAPRPVGSLFATNGKQRAGSISGGCLEDHFVEQLAGGNFCSGAELYTYGKVDGVDSRLELPCGGTIRLLIEFLEPGARMLAHFQQLADSLTRQLPCSRTILLPSGKKNWNGQDSKTAATSYTHKEVNIHYAQPWKVLILGASSVAEYVSRFAQDCGYEVALCDCREEIIANWKVQGIVPEYNASDLFIERQPSLQYCAVLALAHDPRVDDLGLMMALRSNPFYVGAMGSRRTSEARRVRLLRSGGVTEQQLAALHAPIGLPIHSKTPAEIAISIMADLTLARNTREPDERGNENTEQHRTGIGCGM